MYKSSVHKNSYSLLFGLSIILFGCSQSSDSSKAEWIKYNDPQTGREVWQITTDSLPSVACYFEGQAFSGDEKYMVFSSARSGTWKLYKLSIDNGEISSLTGEDRKIDDDKYTFMPDGRRVSYMDEWKLYATDIYTGKEEMLFDYEGLTPLPPRFSGSFTKDGKYTPVFIVSDSLKAIYRTNLETGEFIEVHRRDQGRISHPLINPENPDIISYVPGPDTQNDMTLPLEMRARTWKIDLAKETDERFLTVPYGFRATHESWSWDGERFFFFRKTRPGWSPVAICSMNKDGNDVQVHFETSTIRLGHGVSSRDGKWFISDSQEPGKNELVLLNLNTGEANILCWPNSSIDAGHSAFAHVHPSFSPKGNFVCYTSDRTGIPQVYIVAVRDLTQSK